MTNAIRLCCTYILSKNVPMNTNRRLFGHYRTHGYTIKNEFFELLSGRSGVRITSGTPQKALAAASAFLNSVA